MRKFYVLDTNVLMQTAGRALRGFDDNMVVITYTTLEELDHLKSAPAERGYEARETIRVLGEISNNKNIINEKGGSLLIYAIPPKDKLTVEVPEEWDYCRNDNRILIAVQELSTTVDCPVVLVTNDIAMRIKAEMYGLPVQSYHNDRISSSEDYKGRDIIESSVPVIFKFFKSKYLYESDFADDDLPELIDNEYFFIKDKDGECIAKYKKDKGLFELIETPEDNEMAYGVVAQNMGQRFLIDALLAPANEIPLVVVKGPAGSGKTYLSIACALEKIYNTDEYKKVLITRSNTLADAEMGALPGTLEEKMSPLLAPFYDNIKNVIEKKMHIKCETNTFDGEKFLKLNKNYKTEAQMQVEDLFETGLFEIVSIAYIRGRSIPDSFIIVDEVQNLSVMQAKTLLTRAGINSKIVFMGDPHQIDKNTLDSKNNGLVYLSEKFKDSSLCAQIEFEADEIVRSPLALEAIRRLER